MLAIHQRGVIDGSFVKDVYDTACPTEIVENKGPRIRMKDTDIGREFMQRIEELTALHDAYRQGTLSQNIC